MGDALESGARQLTGGAAMFTQRAFVLLLVVLVAGCAGGRDFTRRQVETLQLGKTTYSQMIVRWVAST